MIFFLPMNSCKPFMHNVEKGQTYFKDLAVNIKFKNPKILPYFKGIFCHFLTLCIKGLKYVITILPKSKSKSYYFKLNSQRLNFFQTK